jgi:hypothetical protein
MLPLNEVDELVAELLMRMPLMVLLRGSSPCNVDERIRAYKGCACSVPALTFVLGGDLRNPRPNAGCRAAACECCCRVANLTALTLMLSRMVLLRSSSGCCSDEKKKRRARGRLPACTMELMAALITKAAGSGGCGAATALSLYCSRTAAARAARCDAEAPLVQGWPIKY